MHIHFVYRAFHDDYSIGRNSFGGFSARVQESSHQYPDRRTVAQHFNLGNRTPTPWISTTTDLLRAIKRARQLAHKHGTDGVSIAIISLDQCQDCEFHLAEVLATNLNLTCNVWHEEEYLFRWEVPGNAVVSCLSLETLENRGLYDLVPQVLTHASVEEWKQLIWDNWMKDRPRRYMRAVDRMAAEVACLFGDGKHMHCVGFEAASWWEEDLGKIVKRSFYMTLGRNTELIECFD